MTTAANVRPSEPSRPPPSPGVLVGELAARLGTSRSAILRAVASGRFPAPTLRDSRKWRRWSDAVAVALEVAHVFDGMAAQGFGLGARVIILRSEAMRGERAALEALHELDTDDVSRLPFVTCFRVTGLRATPIQGVAS